MRLIASSRSALIAFNLAALAALTALAGCGGTYQPSRDVSFEIDRDTEIDDDDISKAFAARPQMPRASLKIAYYTFDPEIVADLDAMLAALPGVKTVYRIPPLLVTGQRRLTEGDTYMMGPPREVSVKKLRLLAARAGADVLIMIDHGYKNIGANPLISLSGFIITVFFVPFLNTVVNGYVEAFVMDVRNGYLYGHIIEEDVRGEAYATIYAKSTRTYAGEQWVDLRAAAQKNLKALIESERSRAPEQAAPPPQPEAPPAPAPPPSL